MSDEWPKQITYKDVPALEYESGVILNADTKKIMKPAERALFQVGGDNDPVKALETRYERAVHSAMQALANGESVDDVVEGAYSGWQAVNEAMKRLALDTSKGHASVRAAEFIGKATGFMGGDHGVSVRSPDGYTIRAESQAAMRELVDMLRSARTPAYGGDGDE